MRLMWVIVHWSYILLHEDGLIKERCCISNTTVNNTLIEIVTLCMAYTPNTSSREIGLWLYARAS